MPTSDRIFYLTGSGQPGFEVEVPQGAPTTETPFGALEPTHTIFYQVYMQRASAYRRPEPNAICDPSISGGRLAYFCDDSPRVPHGIADIVSWTRTWATIPLTHSSYSSTNVTYPGFVGDHIGSPNQRPFRNEFQITTRAKIVYEYFLVGPKTIYPNESAIPFSGPLTVDFFDQYGFKTVSIELFSQSISLYNDSSPGTVPTAITYFNLVTTDTNTATSYSLISEQSKLEYYIGNIWRRVAVRIKAK